MEQSLLTYFMTIAFKMRARAEKFAIRPDLTSTQARALGFIERIEETEGRGVIQRELAEATRTTAASVSNLIDGLEQKGYLERRASPVDVRRKELHLLPKAKGLTADFDREMERAEHDLLSPLTPAEQATLRDLLRRIDENFEPDLPMRRP